MLYNDIAILTVRDYLLLGAQLNYSQSKPARSSSGTKLQVGTLLKDL